MNAHRSRMIDRHFGSIGGSIWHGCRRSPRNGDLSAEQAERLSAAGPSLRCECVPSDVTPDLRRNGFTWRNSRSWHSPKQPELRCGAMPGVDGPRSSSVWLPTPHVATTLSGCFSSTSAPLEEPEHSDTFSLIRHRGIGDGNHSFGSFAVFRLAHRAAISRACGSSTHAIA